MRYHTELVDCRPARLVVLDTHTPSGQSNGSQGPHRSQTDRHRVHSETWGQDTTMRYHTELVDCRPARLVVLDTHTHS